MEEEALNPYRVINANSMNPLILTCEHASSYIPEKYQNLGLSTEQLDTHIARDKGCALLTEKLSVNLNCTAFLANYSRLLIDYNRRENEDSLIVEQSDGVTIVGNLDLTVQEKQYRIEKYHRPYYQAIFAKIADLREHGIMPMIFSVHGFTPQLKGGAFRPWNAGILYARENPLAIKLLRSLQKYSELKVDANVPYDMRRYNTGVATVCGEDIGLENAVIEIRDTEFDNMTEGVAKWADILTDVFQEKSL